MSVEIMTQVWNTAPYEGTSLLLLLSLADYSNMEGVSWPGVTTLAKKIRRKERQTQYLLRKLEKDGVLQIIPMEGTSNAYVLTLSRTQREVKQLAKQVTEIRFKTSKKGGAIATAPGGVQQLLHRGGATTTAPDPSLNHQLEQERSRKRTPSLSSSQTIEADPAIEEVARAISKVTDIDWDLNKNDLIKAARPLLQKSPAAAALILKHYGTSGWWFTRWPGTKGDLPQLGDIKKKWGQWGSVSQAKTTKPKIMRR
jgi:hypothetical protein